MISIKGLDKAELLAALVNAAQPRGMGFLQDDGQPMSREEAQERIDQRRSLDMGHRAAERLYFDYVKGRPVKVNLSGDELDPRLYDRDQGHKAAERVVNELRRRVEVSI